MEQKSWIKAEWGVTENNRRAKCYKLTKTGRKQLEGEVSSYGRLTDAIAKILQTAYVSSQNFWQKQLRNPQSVLCAFAPLRETYITMLCLSKGAKPQRTLSLYG
jgi:Transcriptional regulator PadR-like family